MSQLVNLVLTDRQLPTAVAHTFVPRNIDGNVATVNESTGVPIGDNRVTISNTRTASGRYKVVAKYSMPIVQNQVINGVTTPVVVRVAYGEVSLNFAETSSEQERSNMVGIVASSLAATQTMMMDTMVKLQGIF